MEYEGFKSLLINAITIYWVELLLNDDFLIDDMENWETFDTGGYRYEILTNFLITFNDNDIIRWVRYQ